AGDGGIDLGAPALAPLGGIDTPEGAVLVADVDRSFENTGRGLERAGLELPLLLSGREIEGVEVLVVAADVRHAIDNGGGRRDATRQLDVPENLQLVRQLL